MKNIRILSGLVGGAVIGASLMYLVNVAPLQVTAKEAPEVRVEEQAVSRDTRLTTSFSPIIKRVAPSVVSVETERMVRTRRSPLLDDPLFRHFFGVPEEDSRAPRRERRQGLGSGVIVTEDGYILTNNHVVEGADEIKVVLADRREFTAKVVGTDAQTDVAVLKVEATDLPAITFTDSDNLEVGDVVLAIGNPFGVGQTVTMGIVSAVRRSVGILGRGGYEDFIQTDAAINVGNSGGALVDAEGRLVGVNTAIASLTGGNVGIGFAIPVNMARSVMDQIVTQGSVARGYLGVYIQSLTPELAKAFGLEDQKGALVGSVSPDAPAAEAGLAEGDVIVKLNGREIEDSRELRLKISQTAPGTTVDLTVIREGEEKKIAVKLGELPAEMAGIGGMRGGDSVMRSGVFEGVRLSELNDQARRQFDIPDSVEGVLVMDVRPDSAAYAAGLRAGEVVVSVDRKRVSRVNEAVRAGRNSRSGQVLLQVWSSGGGARWIVVDTSRNEE